MATTKITLEDLFRALQMSDQQIARKEKGIALARLKALGLQSVCPRCGGCGMYGPMSVEAGRCFGCFGTGAHIPRLSKKFITSVADAVVAGGLDVYLADCKARASVKKAIDETFVIWTSSGVSKAYDWRKAVDGDPYHRAVSDQNKRLANAHDEIVKVVDQLRASKDAEQSTTLARQIAAMLDDMRVIAADVRTQVASIAAEFGVAFDAAEAPIPAAV